MLVRYEAHFPVVKAAYASIVFNAVRYACIIFDCANSGHGLPNSKSRKYFRSTLIIFIIINISSLDESL